jgi:predicted phosphoadenosine phosphosulfate sulfurtransferase
MLSLCSKAMEAKIYRYVNEWKKKGYQEGIPDEAPLRLESYGIVPSWRNICKAILKNDIQLTTLGYSRSPCDAYNALKKDELKIRGVIRARFIQYGLYGESYECF